jgi:hypothetical protein
MQQRQHGEEHASRCEVSFHEVAVRLAPNAILDVNGDALMARAEVCPRVVIQAPKARVRIIRYELIDHGWAASSPMLPNKPRGIPRVHDRRVFTASLREVCSTGCSCARAEPRRNSLTT